MLSMMYFKQVLKGYDLINSEGPILQVVLGQSSKSDFNEVLYLKGICLNGEFNLLTPVNYWGLKLYLDRKIKLSELFKINSNIPYVLKKNDKSGTTYVVSYDDALVDVIDQMECGEYYFHELNEDMRLCDPYHSVLQFVQMFQNQKLAANVAYLSGSQFVKLENRSI